MSRVADYVIFLMTLYDIIFGWWSSLSIYVYAHGSDENASWTWLFKDHWVCHLKC